MESGRLSEIQFSLAIATIIVSVDSGIALAVLLVYSGYSAFYVISILLILEFGIMLIVGALLMSRQPLDDTNRYDDEGHPVQSWRAALIGRTVLISSLFVLAFAALFGFLEGVF
ncbi:hypothetical protein EU537_10620 [Candidatus Thorarchaeota archaeon]|nr:MAG: hypothetical protein EU537_10620 [Candidatus Thorarchaeota archaeon]